MMVAWKSLSNNSDIWFVSVLASLVFFIHVLTFLFHGRKVIYIILWPFWLLCEKTLDHTFFFFFWQAVTLFSLVHRSWTTSVRCGSSTSACASLVFRALDMLFCPRWHWVSDLISTGAAYGTECASLDLVLLVWGWEEDCGLVGMEGSSPYLVLVGRLLGPCWRHLWVRMKSPFAAWWEAKMLFL